MRNLTRKYVLTVDIQLSEKVNQFSMEEWFQILETLLQELFEKD